MLISVHLPKTAGSSFRKSLEAHFGDRLFPDYGDRPINTPPGPRYFRALRLCLRNALRRFESIECIHGHFLPLKYLSLCLRRNVRFITWVREPAARVVSHYYYFQRTYRPDAPSRLQRRMVEEQWSLERFCLCPELRDFYCQFLWGVPRRTFAFVGVVEHFQEDLGFFGRRFLGANLPVYEENVDEKKKDRNGGIDPELRRKIESYHARDVALYRRVLAAREARPQT